MADANALRRDDRKRKIKLGVCADCSEPATHGTLCKDHSENRKRIAEEYYKRAKKLVFDHYGNACSCCGESTVLFLTIDHVNNDGAQQRKTNHGYSGRYMYGWIVNHGFPDDLQLLCMNCNFGKQMNGGICPHKTNK